MPTISCPEPFPLLAMTMAIPVAKRVRDVFYKHRASGMIGHSTVFVGMVRSYIYEHHSNIDLYVVSEQFDSIF